MSFEYYFRNYTGLSVEDLFNLIWGEHTEEDAKKTVKEVFELWLAEENPSQEQIVMAKKRLEEFV